MNASTEQPIANMVSRPDGPSTQGRMRRLLLRGVIATATLLTVSSVVVVLLHLPFGRRWLMRIGGCPVGNTDPAVIERARAAAVLTSRGARLAPSRTGWGFELGSMTVQDTEAWAKRFAITCEHQREDTWLQCANVPAKALGDSAALDELNFSFSPTTKRLVALTGSRFRMSGVAAHEFISQRASDLESAFGAAQAPIGNLDGLLSGGPATVTVAYRFRDLAVDLTAQQIAGRGVASFESYQAVPEP
jgi:hypothetical protein